MLGAVAEAVWQEGFKQRFLHLAAPRVPIMGSPHAFALLPPPPARSAFAQEPAVGMGAFRQGSALPRHRGEHPWAAGRDHEGRERRWVW